MESIEEERRRYYAMLDDFVQFLEDKGFVVCDDDEPVDLDEMEKYFEEIYETTPLLPLAPATPYIVENLFDILTDALLELVNERPPDPILFVAKYLIKNKAHSSQQHEDSVNADVQSASTEGQGSLPEEKKQTHKIDERSRILETFTYGPRIDYSTRMAVRDYLDATVIPILTDAVRILANEMPEDPIQSLALYLIKYKTKYYQ